MINLDFNSQNMGIGSSLAQACRSHYATGYPPRTIGLKDANIRHSEWGFDGGKGICWYKRLMMERGSGGTNV